MFLAVLRAWGKLIRPVHPVDSGIDVVFVTGADFKDSRDPVVVGALPGLHRIVGVFLALNRRAVGDKDEALAVVLDSVY